MSQHSRVPPSFLSIKSLPGEFRFSGSPSSERLEKPDDGNLGNIHVISSIISENGDPGDGAVQGVEGSIGEMDQVIEDSPYGGNAVSVEYRPLMGDEDLDSVASHLPSISASHSDRRWGDTTSYAAKKKLQSWIQLPNGNWELGKILSTSALESVVSMSDGRVLNVKTESLVQANPDILDGVDDLMQLSYLNEPSVLYNLQYRYNRDIIYTKAGPVLVAINPFKKVPLYGNDYIEAYKCKSIESPHVYAITDTAMREMIRDEVNQSIIISGESGAGKTETAKIAMQYLAALGGGSGIEHEILKTNPILEAFGNAKTSRNDNSSRFGKLIEIHFSETGKISGANIQTFLLEKSRVVQCTEGERSYHIFYQLCAGAPAALREKINLKSADEYKYLRQSDCYSITGVNDTEQFHIVVEALDVVHVKKEDQQSVFAMLAAVLWLGNISFTVIDNENHVEAVADEGLYNAAKLIGCDIGELKLALSTRKMRVGSDSIVQKLTLSQAIDTRDALAKSIYACLFEWLVEQINKSLAVGKRRTGRSIGILDIYGFESFDRNSFEQFCINYANERLQQHFNRHLFKLEQEEYIQDGIDWTKVDFEDNQDCLSLFEKKPLGLLSLLDEESTFPNGTDLTFANKLKQHLNSNSCFRGERGKAFSVCHYAGEVMYDTTGFLEKNRDLLHLDSIQLLSSCSCQLAQTFASSMLTQSEKPAAGPSYKSGGADSQKLSVATKFKGQLFKLMQRLESTTPHFIRCIKPNNLQSPGLYEQGLVLQQLRCCGVLEVVRISRSGFPTRMSHQKFARRYGFLLLENAAFQDPLSVSVAILHQFNILPEMYQVGYTKLFFRTGQIGVLEDTRNRTLHGILRVQSCFRGYQARRYLKELRRGIATLQSFVRGDKTRSEYAVLLQKHRAAIIIQKQIKGRIAMRKLKSIHDASLRIQSVVRGFLVRKFSGDIGLLKSAESPASLACHVSSRTVVSVVVSMDSTSPDLALSVDSVANDLKNQNLGSDDGNDRKRLGLNLEDLNWDHSFVRELPGDPRTDNMPREVLHACYTKVLPSAEVESPQLVAWSESVSELLDLDPQEFERPDIPPLFSGASTLVGALPYAQCYGGHQFGMWAGQLGDGRAITLGEIINLRSERWELQLKGAGKTPYSRAADGLAVLRSSIREFLCSEAMHSLGIPTTRALCLVTTGKHVTRDMFYDGNPKEEPGAIVCRVAQSFLRFGSYQIHSSRGKEDLGIVRALADYAIRHHFPHIENMNRSESLSFSTGNEDHSVVDLTSNKYAAWAVEVAERTATLIASWQGVGFTHGVLNTDNMSILGLSIDYGPFGFLDAFDPSYTPNRTDLPDRRYRFANQPDMGLWNVGKFTSTLSTAQLINDKEANYAMERYGTKFMDEYQAIMTKKLGLPKYNKQLISKLLNNMAVDKVDYTNFFRVLSNIKADPSIPEEDLLVPLKAVLLDIGKERKEAWIIWVKSYIEELAASGISDEERKAKMDGVNPKYVLRNYLCQSAIDAAEIGDFGEVRRLLKLMERPYDEQPGMEKYARLPPAWAYRPGVGMLSCSS